MQNVAARERMTSVGADRGDVRSWARSRGRNRDVYARDSLSGSHRDNCLISNPAVSSTTSPAARAASPVATAAAASRKE